jgi:hypothetical protein
VCTFWVGQAPFFICLRITCYVKYWGIHFISSESLKLYVSVGLTKHYKIFVMGWERKDRACSLFLSKAMCHFRINNSLSLDLIFEPDESKPTAQILFL